MKSSLISNAYRTTSLSIPSVQREVNEAKGYGLDPLELLIQLQDRADELWETADCDQSRESFLDQYVSSFIARL